MRCKRRLRCWIARCLLTAAALLLVADIATNFGSVAYGCSPWAVGLDGGAVSMQVSRNIAGPRGWEFTGAVRRAWWWRHDHTNISGRLISDAYRVPLWWTWSPLLAGGVWALWSANKRSLRPTCGQCGYDLSGLNPDSPCPECGCGVA